MSPVEPHGIAREQPAHEPRESRWTAEQKDVNMIVHENPSDDPRSTRLPYLAHPRNKMLTVFVIRKNVGSIDASDYYMMKRSGCIQSGFSRYRRITSDPNLL